MSKEKNEPNGVALGIALGAVLGAGALYLLNATRNPTSPVLQKIGRTISEFGEMIEHCDFNGPDMVRSIEKKGADAANSVVDWIDTGFNILRKLSRR
jgi:hypothetical protein